MSSAAHQAGPASADVVIIGGGMVGLTLGHALAQAGLDVVALDREPPATRTDAGYDGRASAITYGSRRVLEGLGLWPALADAACPILDIRVSDGQSRLFLHYDHTQVGDQPLGHIVENTATGRALIGALDSAQRLRHMAPAEATGVAWGPGAATVALADGRSVRAALVVGADGRNSPTRHGAGIAVTQWGYDQAGIVCTVGHDRPHRNVAHERFLPAGPFALLPMTAMPEHPHRSSIVWTERAALAPAMLKLSDRDFSAEMTRRFGDYLGPLRLIGRRWSYPLGLLHAQRYAAPRLALVGDAAHAIHPIAGQGLNLGLRDVAALAEVLVDAHRLGLDLGSLAVLERYERWRRVDALALIAVTDGLNRLFSNDLAPVRLARDIGLAAVNLMPPVKRLLMRHAMGTIGQLPRLVRGERL
jgi:2-octaprenyl-6-methoxyphenol hydroxylase